MAWCQGARCEGSNVGAVLCSPCHAFCSCRCPWSSGLWCFPKTNQKCISQSRFFLRCSAYGLCQWEKCGESKIGAAPCLPWLAFCSCSVPWALGSVVFWTLTPSITPNLGGVIKAAFCLDAQHMDCAKKKGVEGGIFGQWCVLFSKWNGQKPAKIILIQILVSGNKDKQRERRRKWWTEMLKKALRKFWN